MQKLPFRRCRWNRSPTRSKARRRQPCQLPARTRSPKPWPSCRSERSTTLMTMSTISPRTASHPRLLSLRHSACPETSIRRSRRASSCTNVSSTPGCSVMARCSSPASRSTSSRSPRWLSSFCWPAFMAFLRLRPSRRVLRRPGRPRLPPSRRTAAARSPSRCPPRLLRRRRRSRTLDPQTPAIELRQALRRWSPVDASGRAVPLRFRQTRTEVHANMG